MNWESIAVFKYVAADDINRLSRQERMELMEADEIMMVAKLSDRNLIKPGPMVSNSEFLSQESLSETNFKRATLFTEHKMY